MNTLCCSTKILSIFPETHVVSNDLTLDTNLLITGMMCAWLCFLPGGWLCILPGIIVRFREYTWKQTKTSCHTAQTPLNYPVLIEIEHRGKQEKQKRIYHSEYYANANQLSFHKNSTNKSFEEFSF